jgi:hypothetical protein
MWQSEETATTAEHEEKVAVAATPGNNRFTSQGKVAEAETKLTFEENGASKIR